MTPDSVALRCRCGAVRGRVDTSLAARRRAGLHVICYCDDCRAYLRAIERDDLLDRFGGSALWQTAPARVVIDAGRERIACLRLSDKGMLRWHSSCCRTPIGNTLAGAGWPFVGMLRACLDIDAGQADAAFGPATHVNGRRALGDVSAFAEPTASLRTIARTAAFLLRSRLAGRQSPTPFFDAAGRPVVTPRVLSTAERDALRARDRVRA
ncbi:hypothetical protein HLB44_00910 [Aquincola sp. S2]|uniref:CENP-V/GFA domain-containing protein n=1 Tax=Pseudaquabacterium terrae TaxID=2732868 RepID=A0ABX2EB28_9BURK|nr:DUF6151 family protein [Aquabacterium terrae]NRF65532.1 hypothetical protein [Aquabacterium terrae]